MTAWILLEHGGDEGIAVELKPTYSSPIGPGVKGEKFRFRLEPEHDAEDDLHRSAQESGEHAYQLLLKERKLNWTATARFSLPETQAKSNVHGRSADLLFALTVLKGCMDEVARRIREPASDFPSFAATGVLVEMNGVARVQRVDGIQAKLRAALKVLPEGGWFFYPADNQNDIGSELKQQAAHLHLYPVERLADAARQLGIDIEGIYLDDPYPGLEPIDYKQRSIFFGREAETEEICDRLLKLEAKKRPGLLVRAASGRGKSSLIRAGVIPALELLRQKQGSPLHERPIIWSAWYPRETGKKPDEVKLVQSILNNWSQAEHAHQLAVLAGQKLSNLAELAEALARHMPEKYRFLWLIDQCEEIFTSNFDDALKHKFADFLQHLQAQGVWVVATLSSAFNHDYEKYLETVFPKDNVYWLEKLRTEALEDVIRKPAENAGAGFEPGEKPGTRLDKQLLQEALAGGTESLPLLAFTLSELWAKRDKEKGQMAYGAYKAISGSLNNNWLDDNPLYKVIGKQADELYESLKSADDHALQRLLRALTRSVREGLKYAIVEQSASITKFSSKFERRLIHRFSKKRLLVRDGDSVRVSHMALLTHWPKAQKIIEGIEGDLRLREKLIGEAQVWEKQQRNASRLLQVGLPLSEGEYLLKQWPEDLDEYPSVIAFVEASSEAERVRQDSVKIKRQRQVRIAIVVAVVFAGLAVAAGLSWWEAINQKAKAEKQTQVAHEKTTQLRQQLVEADHNLGLALNEKINKSAQLHDWNKTRLYALNALLKLKPSSADRLTYAPNILASQNFYPIAFHTSIDSDVFSIAFSPGAKVMASGSRDGIVRLWNVITGKKIEHFRVSDQSIFSVEFSPNGKILAIGAGDNTVYLWFLGTDGKFLYLKGHKKAVESIAFSPDGKILASGSVDGSLLLWNASTGIKIKELQIGGSGIESIAFNQNGKILASGSKDGVIKLWDIISGKAITNMNVGNYILSVAFSPDGNILASGDTEGIIRLWNVATGKELKVLRGHKEGVEAVVFDIDGKTLASASMDHSIRLWNIDTGEEVVRFSNHSNITEGLAFSSDGKTLATGSGGGMIYLWDLTMSKEFAHLPKHENGVLHIALSSDGKTLATTGLDDTVRLWDVATYNELVRLQGYEKPNHVPTNILAKESKMLWGDNKKDLLTSITFSPDGKMLSSGSYDKTIHLWEANTGKLITQLQGHQDHVTSVAFSQDGKTLASGSSDKTVRLWDITTLKEITQLIGHQDFVTSVAFAPDGKTLATAAGDKTVRLWDITTHKEIGQLQGHQDTVNSVAFAPDGKTLASGSSDDTVRLWDITTRKEIALFQGHSSFVQKVVFSPNGKTLASGSWDDTVRLWDITTYKEITQFQGHQFGVQSIAFTPDGKTLLSSDSVKKSVYRWDLSFLSLQDNPTALKSYIDQMDETLRFHLDGIELQAVNNMQHEETEHSINWSTNHPFYWFPKAKQGDSEAMLQLGIIYHRDSNFDKAIDWYSRALINNHPLAEERLRRLLQTAKFKEKSM